MDPNRLSSAICSLAELIVRLRGPDGCPWDARQTDSSIKVYLIEEAYEVLEAIERSSPQDVCMELGDLFFQILFLAGIAEERKEFDFIDVIESVTEKMIRRHPHVFGNTRVDSVEEVAVNWAKIKKEEKGRSYDTSSLLQDVPAGLPALLRAHRLSQRASTAGFDWQNAGEVLKKVREELAELESALFNEDNDEVAEEIGDLMFSLVNLSRHMGFNAEHLLRLANQKFLERFEMMEKRLKSSGIPLEDATPRQMEQAWEEVKKNNMG